MLLPKMREMIQKAKDFNSNIEELNELIIFLTAKNIRSTYAIFKQTEFTLKAGKCMEDCFPSAEAVCKCTPRNKKISSLYHFLKDNIYNPNTTIDDIIQKLVDNFVIVKRGDGLKEFKDLMKMGNELAGSRMDNMPEVTIAAIEKNKKDWSGKGYSVEYNMQECLKTLINGLFKNQNLKQADRKINTGKDDITFRCEYEISFDPTQFVQLLKDLKPLNTITKSWEKEINNAIKENLILNCDKSKIDVGIQKEKFWIHINEDILIKNDLIQPVLIKTYLAHKKEIRINSALPYIYRDFLLKSGINFFTTSEQSDFSVYIDVRISYTKFIDQIINEIEVIEHSLLQPVE